MLQYSDLPQTKPTTISDRLNDLTDAVALAIGPYRECSHQAIAHGGPQSCRLFLVEAREDALPIIRTPREVAAELLQFADESARYPENQILNGRRGWLIRKIELDGRPVAVAEAAWVT